MILKIKEFIKENQDDIILIIGVILISLLSFAIGYLVCQHQMKQPLRFEETGLRFFKILDSVTFPMNITQSFMSYMGVNLRSSNVSMAQKLLHCS